MGERKLGQNISNLTWIFNEKPATVASVINTLKSQYSEILNGKKNLTPEKAEKLARHFGVSPESLKRDDYSTTKPLTDPEQYIKKVIALLPLYDPPEEAPANSHFTAALQSQRELYAALTDTSGILPSSKVEHLLETTFYHFSEMDRQRNVPPEGLADMLSLFFCLFLGIRGVEAMARHKYDAESFPAFTANLLESNPHLQKRFDSLLENDDLLKKENDDEPDDFEYLRNMAKDPNLKEILSDCYWKLKATGQKNWSDLVDYYLALQYIFGAVDNVFSAEQNHDFGLDLMSRQADLENRFAISYLDLMILP